MKLRIAQIKTVPVKGDLEANHLTLMGLLDRIDGESVDVLVTPECFLDGYVCTESEVTEATIGRYAVVPEESPYVRAVREWAKSTRTWVVYGCMRADQTGIYNSSLAIDRTGTIVGTYDKVHCQTHDLKYHAGKSLRVFESDFGPFGMMICADRRWPETVRTLAVRGARIIFNPTYGMHDQRNMCMMQTRSYESEVFIVFCHPWQSLVTDPRGEIVVNNEARDEQITICDVGLSLVDRIRRGASAHLKDRRPDLYE